MIVATSGHVDHGKTELIKALTGTNTDRLPEEKARGLTVDLGFAYNILPDGEVLGFVDVPGHEKFIRNMLAGVLGVDCADEMTKLSPTDTLPEKTLPVTISPTPCLLNCRSTASLKYPPYLKLPSLNSLTSMSLKLTDSTGSGSDITRIKIIKGSPYKTSTILIIIESILPPK